jgi:hypothetical protein
MSLELALIWICASVILTACAGILVFLFAYTLAIFETYREGRRP